MRRRRVVVVAAIVEVVVQLKQVWHSIEFMVWINQPHGTKKNGWLYAALTYSII